MVAGDESLVSDRLPTCKANEAFFVPLFAAEFKLLHASLEDLAASVATWGEVVVMAVGTVEFLVF